MKWLVLWLIVSFVFLLGYLVGALLARNGAEARDENAQGPGRGRRLGEGNVTPMHIRSVTMSLRDRRAMKRDTGTRP